MGSAEVVPLSFAQERLWFLSRLDPASAAYHVACAVRLNGLLAVRELEEAIGRILERHDVLRTGYRDRAGVAQAVVRPYERWQLPVVTLDGLPAERRAAAATELANDHATRPFDLADDAPFRALLVVHGHLRYDLLLTFHHIAFDGTSWGVFFRELESHYRACLEGGVWIRFPVRSSTATMQTGSGAPPQRRVRGGPRLLAADVPRRAAGARCADERLRPEERAVLSPATADAAAAFARECQTTPFVIWLAVFAVLLHRVGGQDDLIVGTPVSTRSRPEMQNLIGFFVNTLPLRLGVSPALTFRAVALQVRQSAAAALSRPGVPFEQIVQEVVPERSGGRIPLCQVLFTYQNDPVPDGLRLPGVDARVRPLDTGTSKFALSLDLRPAATGLEAVLEHDVEWFARPGARAFLDCLELLARGLLGAPDRPIAEAPDLSIDETRRVLGDWAESASPPLPAGMVHELFAACVARTPEATAVVHGRQRISYRQLDSRAEQIAGRLVELGVAPGTLVWDLPAPHARPRRLAARRAQSGRRVRAARSGPSDSPSRRDD